MRVILYPGSHDLYIAYTKLCASMLRSAVITLSRFFALSFSDYAKDNIIYSIKIVFLLFACMCVRMYACVTNTTDITILITFYTRLSQKNNRLFTVTSKRIYSGILVHDFIYKWTAIVV